MKHFGNKKNGSPRHAIDDNKDRDSLDILLTGVTTTELLQHLRRIESQLQKLDLLIDMIYVKAGASHSLLLVRKISEDRLDELESILD